MSLKGNAKKNCANNSTTSGNIKTGWTTTKRGEETNLKEAEPLNQRAGSISAASNDRVNSGIPTEPKG